MTDNMSARGASGGGRGYFDVWLPTISVLFDFSDYTDRDASQGR